MFVCRYVLMFCFVCMCLCFKVVTCLGFCVCIFLVVSSCYECTSSLVVFMHCLGLYVFMCLGFYVSICVCVYVEMLIRFQCFVLFDCVAVYECRYLCVCFMICMFVWLFYMFLFCVFYMFRFCASPYFMFVVGSLCLGFEVCRLLGVCDV